MATIEIPIILGEESVNGTQLAIGAVKASELISKYDIHVYDREKGEMGTKAGGYQREANQRRIKVIADSLINEKIDIPTAIICNIRDFNVKDNLKKNGNSTILKVDAASTKNKFYIIDGQHRTKGLEQVLDDSETAQAWKDKKIFTVFYLGGEFDEEKEAFYFINTTAKSIPTGSKLELKLGIEDVPIAESNAVELTRLVADTSKVWKGLIKYPNSKIGILPNSSFITSLKHLYQQDWFQPKTLDEQLKVLDAFWNGIKIVLPACFEDPAKYTLQRAVGVTVMHNVMGVPYMKLIQQNRDIYDANDWAEFLAPLRTHADNDRTVDEKKVEGSEFWLSGSSGAAGRYSSGAGRTNLIAVFKGKLS